jgi:integrase
MYTSNVRVLERKRKAQPKRLPGEFYDVDQYRQAITRACEEAEVPHWHPNQLRHNAATRIRELFGLEAAKTILGHRLVETTQIYAESDRKRAREIVERVG